MKRKCWPRLSSRPWRIDTPASRRHHLPLRQGGSQALSGHPAGRHRGCAVLHQLVATAGGFTDDAFEALERQDDLQRKYTGGTVLHLYMSENISSIEACRNLVRRALTRFRLPYITITPTFSICPKHGYLSGEHTFCPKCDQEILARKQSAALAV